VLGAEKLLLLTNTVGILDKHGRIEHAVLLELLTDEGVGTLLKG